MCLHNTDAGECVMNRDQCVSDMGPNFKISPLAMRAASRPLTSNRSGQYTRPAVNTTVICLASQFCPVTWRLSVPLGKYSEEVGQTRSPDGVICMQITVFQCICALHFCKRPQKMIV